MENDAFWRGYAAGKAGTSWTAEYSTIANKKEKQSFMTGLLKGQQDKAQQTEAAIRHGHKSNV